MSVVAGVALGGAVGSLSRYGVDRVIEQRHGSVFPWSTFVVNVTGCFVVGFLVAAVVDRGNAPDWLRGALVVGFCGGYTTFSTLAHETLDLVETHDLAMGLLNIGASVILGLLAVLLGARLGRRA